MLVTWESVHFFFLEKNSLRINTTMSDNYMKGLENGSTHWSVKGGHFRPYCHGWSFRTTFQIFPTMCVFTNLITDRVGFIL